MTNNSKAMPLDVLDRALLCIPHGGLNDTLCQIEKCWRYAKKFDRQLIIDTRSSGLMGPFSDYFSVKPRSLQIITKLEERHLIKLNTFDCHPSIINGRIGTYSSEWSNEVRNFVDSDARTKLSFDFTTDYGEKLLVHEQCGGGTKSSKLLNRVTLAPRILPSVLGRISDLPSEYVGVHVRNTDHQTDYETFFRSIYPETIDKNVLVCSDDAEVITRAKIFFDRSVVVTVTNVPHTARAPLHNILTYATDEERTHGAINAIIDLLALGGATQLFFTNVTGGFPSGFSRLASYLSENKDVITALLSKPRSLSSEFRQLVEKIKNLLINPRDRAVFRG